jgi:hypothetical protein
MHWSSQAGAFLVSGAGGSLVFSVSQAISSQLSIAFSLLLLAYFL